MWNKRIVVTGALVASLLAGVPVTASAATKSCKPIVNPYKGTRYEGANLTKIRGSNVSCRTARKVARGAHRKAISTPLPERPRQQTWRGWKFTANLSGASDRYKAVKGSRRVTWRFE